MAFSWHFCAWTATNDAVGLEWPSDQPPQPMALQVGSRLGHSVTALVGEGRMGQVYQATDTQAEPAGGAQDSAGGVYH